ncbi:BTAD domain-containing putative transcriptional regulator [Crossiella sp. CA198]|uniref:AfsR/SARP family transcriptional regulator n=1 Tax=Crossiella sp. CA198 TaxID=3455607 RepID=UPI003F8D645D
MRAETEFRVLGPLEVRVRQAAVPIGAAKHRVLLASLLLHANEPVSAEELIGNLWDGPTPVRPRGSLHTYVTRVRQMLGDPGRLRITGQGYLLDVEPEQLDLFRFRRLVRRAEQSQAAGDVAAEAMLLGEAVGLVRGPVLADVPSAALHRSEVALLTEARLALLERWIEVTLELGRHGEVISRLIALTAEHPLRERFAELLMLARYRDGRQAEALAGYQQTALVLRRELGAGPGPGLRRMQEAVLRADPWLRVQAKPVARAARVPAELPAGVGDFVGRGELVAELGSLLGSGAVVAVSGAPGVGKTALAVRVGHRLRGRFSDGQLFANLRGYSAEPAATAGQVLTRFLRGLGVAPEDVPSAVDEQSALYRRLLAGRRVLVVLDNVAEVDQLAVLLPGDPGCGVLITSRRGLPERLGEQPVRRIALGSLAEDESVELLRRVLGTDDAALGELAAVCARLPLALRVAAANLAAQPAPDVAGYVGLLRAGNRLAELAIDGDGATAVHSAFDSSYRALEPAARTVFRRLALVPGADFTVAAAAALVAGEPAAELAGLAGMSLLERSAADRFAFHDLIRLFATERAEAEESTGERAAALGRLYEYYLATTRQAVALITPDVPLPAAPDLPPAPPFAERAAAVAWLDAELPNLVAAVRAAPGLGLHQRSWPLVRVLGGYFYFRLHRTEWIEAARVALAAAREVGDLAMVGAMLDSVGTALWGLGDFEQALRYHREAIETLAHTDAAPEVESDALLHLGIVYMEMGRLAAAADCYQRVLHRHRPEGGNRAKVLLNLAAVRMYGGDLAAGLALAREALAICQEQGIAFGEALCLGNLAVAERLRGNPVLAINLARRSREIYQALGQDNADPVDALAAALLAADRAEEALPLAEQACELAATMHDRRAEADAYNTRAACCAALDRPREAERHHTEALRIATLAGYLLGEINALAGQGAVFAGLGRLHQARDRLRGAAAAAARGGFRLEEDRVRGLLAELPDTSI